MQNVKSFITFKILNVNTHYQKYPDDNCLPNETNRHRYDQLLLYIAILLVL